jgi:hypothetical protein
LTALKQAVLLYDELLFVDPVDPQARSALYLEEARTMGTDPTVTRRWQAAQDAYELLDQAGLVRTVSSEVLRDPASADTLAIGNLSVDEHNGASRFFQGRHRWQILADRMPPSLRSGAFGARTDRGWGGFPIVEVPYAVGASVTTTYALAIAHEVGAVPMTDSRGCHSLLLARLQAAASAEGNLPGLHAPPRSPYMWRQIELRLVDALAPAEALGHMTLDAVLEYRQHAATARSDLAKWINRLVDEAHSRPWDPELEHELADITRRAQEIAAQPGRWGAALAAARPQVSPGALGAQAVQLAAPPTVAAALSPDVSLVAALAIGGSVALAKVTAGVSAAVQALLAKRPAEHNAVSYLLNARAR